MAKRAASQYDLDILKELKTYWHNQIKIDTDITGNPCLFIKYKGPWDIFYILSDNGRYIHQRSHYVIQAHAAALNYCEKKDKEYINAKKEKEYSEKFDKLKTRIDKKGFVDDLPEWQGALCQN